jgi:four helix bundle protein
MNYDEWEVTVPDEIRGEVIWRVQAFRLASFLAAAADFDCEGIAGQPRFAKVTAQLTDAAASIPANIAEGYARLSPRDRVRYYEYAYGSAAEAKSRYLSLRRALSSSVVDARLLTLASIGRLLLKMIRSGRPDSPVSPEPPRPPTS